MMIITFSIIIHGGSILSADIPDGAVRGLVSSLSLTFHLYRDSQSRKQVHTILECLLDKKHDVTHKACLGVLCSFAEEQRKNALS